MGHEFRRIAWNIEKVERHGLDIGEVEDVINGARRPYPRPIGNEKWLVIGPTHRGLIIPVIYIIDAADTLFVIHARPLTPNERRRRRRRK